MFYVDRNLRITSTMPSQGYQFKHEDRSECEQYVENAKQNLSDKQKRKNEEAFLRQRGGQKMIDSVFGEEYEKKRKAYDDRWDEIRKSKKT